MVVSKDSKRKRKQSPAVPAQPTVMAVESSPEMPKRTKVQAQRKFAQGQSAPASSYSSMNAASSSSNTGPSTSSESREPPTEILPNKRPKTEDFLTFLCFRGTPELPAHLDFLNQGKSKEAAATKKKPPPPKIIRKGKKGRSKGNTKASNANLKQTAATAAAVSAVAATTATSAAQPSPIEGDKPANRSSSRNGTKESTVPNESGKAANVGGDDTKAISAFAVRKRAGIVNEGNRRGRGAHERQAKSGADADKSNSTTQEAKRRTVKPSANAKTVGDADTDDGDDEYFSANDEAGRAADDGSGAFDAQNTEGGNKTKANAKSPALSERKSETPSKESETGKGRRGGRTITVNKNKSAVDGAEASNAKGAAKASTPDELQKEKPPPVKRSRQKESPIFIPSPEPSGRMTRQRAFFEPVKVPHREEEGPDMEEQQKVADAGNVDKTPQALQKPESKQSAAADDKVEQHDKSKDMNVFDFSSDDEQPLAKSMRMKRAKASPKKLANARKSGRKPSPKKAADTPEKRDDANAVGAAAPKAAGSKVAAADKNSDKAASVELSKVTHELQHQEQKSAQNSATKNKAKRGRGANKKKASELADAEQAETAQEEDDEGAPSSPKKALSARQSRKKLQTLNGDAEADADQEPVRAQRPSRKTKEAATIYMGIIGHKLQLGEDEDDDISLNSFPDLPNVKEMQKMENELKKHAAQSASSAKSTTASPTVVKSAAKQQATPSTPAAAAVAAAAATVAAVPDKPATAPRRGRPPKAAKQPLPPKREIEGMLVKKGALTKLQAPIDHSVGAAVANSVTAGGREKAGAAKLNSEEDEDFLLNEEVNETKRKLEKSFSDSDDEPLAIKAHIKPGDKEAAEQDSRHSDFTSPQLVATSALQMLPLTTKPVLTPPISASVMSSTAAAAMAAGAVMTTVQLQSLATTTTSTSGGGSAAAATAAHVTSPFKTVEKKSPVPTSKILNVPATYGTPSAPGMSVALNAGFSKPPYLAPSAPQHYHTAAHIRPAHQFSAAAASTKSPPVPAAAAAVAATSTTPHLTAPPLPPQSPLKYQTPPTTYPPPIEAYPSPKINPNFLTPKFDRTLPRSNNFPSPSPVKFDMLAATTKAGMVGNSPKLPLGGGMVAAMPNAASTSAAAAASGGASSDPLKDEIGSILAANLMPSKEESGKIFGIASVSLAQSSGPDNTKCTLGKCGSIHKPVLGPVVPTEGYIGDQLSSKERRKAKVNMTHEQIQKWLIECSSNPDEIQDDLDDDFDDNLRPNMSATTPPPTRDDKESTSFSSSSKATRDLGKSESAWSAKGPSLKATPVIASANRKEDVKFADQLDLTVDNDKANNQAINLSHKTAAPVEIPKQSAATQNEPRATAAAAVAVKEKPERKADKRMKDDKAAKETHRGDSASSAKQSGKNDTTGAANSAKYAAAGKHATQTAVAVEQQVAVSTAEPPPPKPGRKKNISPASNAAAAAASLEKQNAAAAAAKAASTTAAAVTPPSATGAAKTPKRTPVYNQKTPKQAELKEAVSSGHKKTAATASATLSYSAFSVDNEKSIYSFDKDDEHVGGGNSKLAYRRPSRQDSHTEDTVAAAPVVSSGATPTRGASSKRAAALSERAEHSAAKQKDTTQAPNSSVSLTLSPAENSKLVKVSLEAEKAVAAKQSAAATGKSGKASKKLEASAVTAAANDAAADSDSDGHTFYIPLQGSGTGGDADGGIQGVAVKLGREGPEGPNQKVIMHATLVTKAQMGSNAKPPPDSMNVSDIVKTLMSSTGATSISGGSAGVVSTDAATVGGKKGASQAHSVTASTSAAAAAAADTQKGTLGQSRIKAGGAAESQHTATANPTGGGGGLVRVNSNSSLLSVSGKSRIGGAGATTTTSMISNNKKFKDDTPIKMANNTAFPRHDDPTQMVEAPIFRPTEKEFADPIEFIERITPIAARFGICKIIPPSTFKPECRISDEMRFTAYNQYVHKMLHRWGPSVKELSAIKKYLATQSIVMNHPPWIGGMEVDLPRLYHTVQELGGLKEVIEKKKWARVAEEMCIPKLAQDRVTKLDDIYCKYLLPYDTLAPAERQKLFDEVEADWAKREARARRNADRFVNTESVSNEDDDVSSEDDEESEEEVDGVSMECIVKGRSMPLSQFYRIARNTMALWFKNTEPTVNEVEAEFWRHVAVRDSHVCVHSGSIDSSGWGYGFPSPGPKGKGSNYARHPWNLKVLTNNPGSVLRSLGPVMGVTVPTLHVGMLFSACCWYRDPHGLSWIEYLHTGASKLWYGIPDDQSANFRAALTALIPTHCQNKTIWLPCDTVMVPPHMLTDRGVSLCRIEQKPGEFIVVFPRAYTSSLATGYVVSESVYFATTSWLELAKDDFRDIHDSCEPAMFSLEQLLFALGYDQRVTGDTKHQMLPMLNEVFEKETAAREQLKAAGVTSTEKVHNEKGAKAKKQPQPPFKSIDSECDLCRANLYISMVRTEDGNNYCLQHALKNLNRGNIQAKQCKLIYAYNVEDIENLIRNLKDKMQTQRRPAVAPKKLK